VRQTIDQWEAETRRKDPDYPVKAAAVRRIGQALLQERGAPQSPAEARQLVQAAYDEATTMLLGRVPRRSRRGARRPASMAQPRPALEPKTMKEAAVMALENNAPGVLTIGTTRSWLSQPEKSPTSATLPSTST
jgi:hypothetical protein